MRYQVVGPDEAKKFENYEDWAPYDHYEYNSYLIDGAHGVVVFSDRCEPEDATLDRHFSTLVDLLNEVGATH